jgi:hypothetical protein
VYSGKTVALADSSAVSEEVGVWVILLFRCGRGWLGSTDFAMDEPDSQLVPKCWAVSTLLSKMKQSFVQSISNRYSNPYGRSVSELLQWRNGALGG